MEVLRNLSNSLDFVIWNVFLDTFSYCQSACIISVKNSFNFLVQVVDDFSSFVAWHRYDFMNFSIDHSYNSIGELFQCNVVSDHHHGNAFFYV